MRSVGKINKLIDELKAEGVSFVVVATEDNSDGYCRVVTNESTMEDIHIEDLLSGMAQASSALRDRLKEVKGEV